MATASLYGPGYQSRYVGNGSRNPWDTYNKSLGSQNWYGSSGYWGGPPVPGAAPGDASKAMLATNAGLPVPAGNPYGARTGTASSGVGGFGMPGQRPMNPQDFLGSYNLPSRYPEVSSATGNLFRDVAAADKTIALPSFDEIKNQFSTATGDIGNWYNRYQAGNDISGFAQGQRAADAAAAGLTDQFARTARGILGQAEGVVNRYRTEGQGALDKVLGNAQDYYNKDIPASIQDAQNRAVQYTSRYGMGRGLGSDIAQMAGRSAVQAALPFQREGRGFIGNALERYQPFYGDVASRDYNRLAALNMPTEQNIYGAQVGDVMRGKSTEQQIQSLDMLVKERGLNAAVANLQRQGLPQQLINDLIGQWQRLKGGNLALAGQAAGLEQQYGAERGYYDRYGSPVEQPQYYGLPRPNFPTSMPNRYGPGNTSTGNTSGGGGGGGPSAGQPEYDIYGRPTGRNMPAGVPALDPAYIAQRQMNGVGGGRYANTGQFGSSQPQGYFQRTGTEGVWDIPNDYTFGRNPREQAEFEQIQRGYE